MNNYSMAEQKLKDYFSGKLQTHINQKRHVLEVDYQGKEELKEALADDLEYKGLVKEFNAIRIFLNNLEKTNKTSFDILVLFYEYNHSWKEIAEKVLYSETTCKDRRHEAIKELTEWLFAWSEK